MTGTGIITQDELAEVLRRFHFVTQHSCDGGSFHWEKALFPDEAAERIFRLARESREPEYDDGAMYVDAYGEYWRYDSTLRAWFAFSAAGASAFHVPKRPLRKLLPEPGDTR